MLDFLPEPGDLQVIINQRLPGLEPTPAATWGRPETEDRPVAIQRSQGFILLNFLPSLAGLAGVIRDHRTTPLGGR